jgi:hypothetical protein
VDGPSTAFRPGIPPSRRVGGNPFSLDLLTRHGQDAGLWPLARAK